MQSIQNIKLKGAGNVRDFGGLKNKHGKMINPHMFLRGSVLNDISYGDADTLTHTYEVKHIIDLRTHTEIREKPDREIDGVEWTHIPLLTSAMLGITHEKDLDNKNVEIPELPAIYRKIVSNPFSIEKLKEVFEVICDDKREGALLWHCTEGKDRCGLVSALFLYMLDVDMDTIFDDYVYTNTVSAAKGKKAYWKVLLSTGDKSRAEAAREAYIADRKYLEAAFEEIEMRYGTLDNFMEQELLITPQVKQKMLKRATR